MNRRCIYTNCSWTWAAHGEDESWNETLAIAFRKSFAEHLRSDHEDDLLLFLAREDACVMAIPLAGMPRWLAMCDLYALDAGLIGDIEEERGAKAWRDAGRRWLIQKEMAK